MFLRISSRQCVRSVIPNSNFTVNDGIIIIIRYPLLIKISLTTSRWITIWAFRYFKLRYIKVSVPLKYWSTFCQISTELASNPGRTRGSKAWSRVQLSGQRWHEFLTRFDIGRAWLTSIRTARQGLITTCGLRKTGASYGKPTQWLKH